MNTELLEHPDGAISATVTISLTPAQWREFRRAFSQRAGVCSIGLDTPQIEDFVLFQVLKQLKS